MKGGSAARSVVSRSLRRGLAASSALALTALLIPAAAAQIVPPPPLPPTPPLPPSVPPVPPLPAPKVRVSKPKPRPPAQPPSAAVRIAPTGEVSVEARAEAAGTEGSVVLGTGAVSATVDAGGAAVVPPRAAPEHASPPTPVDAARRARATIGGVAAAVDPAETPASGVEQAAAPATGPLATSVAHVLLPATAAVGSLAPRAQPADPGRRRGRDGSSGTAGKAALGGGAALLALSGVAAAALGARYAGPAAGCMGLSVPSIRLLPCAAESALRGASAAAGGFAGGAKALVSGETVTTVQGGVLGARRSLGERLLDPPRPGILSGPLERVPRIATWPLWVLAALLGALYLAAAWLFWSIAGPVRRRRSA